MQTQNAERIFWPNGARLAVSISMMFGGAVSPFQVLAVRSPSLSRMDCGIFPPTRFLPTDTTKAFRAHLKPSPVNQRHARCTRSSSSNFLSLVMPYK